MDVSYLLDNFIYSGLQRHVLVLHQGADGSGYGEADEVFAGSGGGDGAGLVGGVGSGSDDGRVADAIPAFCGQASGGGSGGDVALLVEGDDAYCSIFVVVGRLEEGGLTCGFRRRSGGAGRDGQVFLLEFFDEILPARFGEEEALRLLLEADVSGEGVCSGADHHYVFRFVHDGAGEGDGMAGVLDVGDGSGLHGGSVHDGGVHLIGAVGGEDGAASGVEERIVFEDFDGGLDGVGGGASFIEDGSGGGDGFIESGAVLALGFGRHGRALDDACSAV